jgi:ParB/RepB/Spo0J family partition protein
MDSVQMSEQQPVVTVLPLGKIQRGNNVRKVDLTIGSGPEFVESVRTHGILQPLLVRPLSEVVDHPLCPTHELVAGNKRFEAAAVVGLTQVPVLVRAMNEQEVLTFQLVENLQREDMTAMDEARALVRLRDELGMSVDQIQEVVFGQTGKQVSRSHVYDTLSLVKLVGEAQAALSAGEITLSQAVEVARLSQELQVEAVETFRESEENHKTSLKHLRDRMQGEQERLERWQKAVADARAKNIPVLGPKEAKSIYGESWREYPPLESGYVDLDQVCQSDKKERSFGKILGKANVTRHLVPWREVPRYLARWKEVAPVLLKLKVPLEELLEEVPAGLVTEGMSEEDAAKARALHEQRVAELEAERAKHKREGELRTRVEKRLDEQLARSVTAKNAERVVVSVWKTYALHTHDADEVPAKPTLVDVAREMVQEMRDGWRSEEDTPVLCALLRIDPAKVAEQVKAELEIEEAAAREQAKWAAAPGSAALAATAPVKKAAKKKGGK